MPFELPDLTQCTKPIPGWEGLYEITADGRVLSLSRRVVSQDGRSWITPTRWLKPLPNSHGYVGVGLYRAGEKAHRWMIHRLVALAWIGPPGPGQTQINHRNSIRSDNRIANLEWVSRAENATHGWRHGHIKQTPARLRAYELGHAARRGLSTEQVAQIRRRVQAGEQQKAVAQSLGIQRSAVCQVVNGKYYATF